jgi:hypothetical protein
MAQQNVIQIEVYQRRRASDRARERATRAAYFGDRAGLLIATGAAEALMSSRTELTAAAPAETTIGTDRRD